MVFGEGWGKDEQRREQTGKRPSEGRHVLRTGWMTRMAYYLRAEMNLPSNFTKRKAKPDRATGLVTYPESHRTPGVQPWAFPSYLRASQECQRGWSVEY